jgi:hypothetical protein
MDWLVVNYNYRETQCAVVPKLVSIRTWESNWERTFKELDVVFFSPSIVNMSAYLIENINYVLGYQNPRLGRDPSKILKQLAQKAASSDIETRMLLLAAPSAIKFFRSNPNLTNLRILRKHLVRIVQVYDSGSLLNAARRTVIRILNDRKAPEHELSSVIPYVLRCLLKRYSQKYVKETPKKVFSTSLANIHRSKVTEGLKISRQVQAEAKPAFDELLATVSGRLGPLDCGAIDSFCQDLYADTRRWTAEPRVLFGNYRKAILKCDRRITSALIDNIPISDGNKRREVAVIIEEPMRDVARGFIRSVILNIVIKCLIDAYPYTQGILELSRRPYPSAVSEAIKLAVHGNSQTYDSFTYLAADSEIWALAISVSTEMERKVPSQLLDQVAAGLVELTLRLIADEQTKNYSKNISFKISVANAATSRFECFLDVKRYLKELMPALLEYTRQELGHITTRTTKKFCAAHARLIIDRLSKDRINSYPNPISARDARHLFDSLFSALDPRREKQWRVYFILGNIDCKSKVFRIGKVTFYDVRDWHFGETENFDAIHNPVPSVGTDLRSLYCSYEVYKYGNGTTELKRNSARAFADLSAIDGYTAAHAAELLVNNALDNLVFASSSRSKDEGFKPQVPIAFEVIDEMGSGFAEFGSAKRSEMLEVDGEYERIVEYYDKLARHHNTALRDSLQRALSLFRRGYWDESISSQFRNYWIALEQLIDSVPRTKSSRKSSIMELVPRLTITWRDTGAAYNIGGLMRNVMGEIRKNQQLAAKVSKHPRLKNWEKSPLLILENIQYLQKHVTDAIISGNLAELHELFGGKHRKYLRSAVLKNRQAEELLVKVLGVFLQNLDSKSIDEIARRQNRPLKIRMSKA